MRWQLRHRFGATESVIGHVHAGRRLTVGEPHEHESLDALLVSGGRRHDLRKREVRHADILGEWGVLHGGLLWLVLVVGWRWLGVNSKVREREKSVE